VAQVEEAHAVVAVPQVEEQEALEVQHHRQLGLHPDWILTLSVCRRTLEVVRLVRDKRPQ
jgi:hypothetical protein